MSIELRMLAVKVPIGSADVESLAQHDMRYRQMVPRPPPTNKTTKLDNVINWYAYFYIPPVIEQ